MKAGLTHTLLLLIAASIFYPLSPVKAQVMQNESHNLFLNPLEDISETEATVSPAPTGKAEQAKSFKKPIIVLREPDPTNISIHINTHLIDFGILSPTSPAIREIDVSLLGSTPSQTLYIKKESPLSNTSENIIPDTSCDQGGCSEFVASDWINTLTFGYGYSCSDKSCDSDFQNTAYRPFSQSLVSLYQIEVGIGNKRMLTIPVKINISGTQENGYYTNSVTLINVPSL